VEKEKIIQKMIKVFLSLKKRNQYGDFLHKNSAAKNERVME